MLAGPGEDGLHRQSLVMVVLVRPPVDGTSVVEVELDVGGAGRVHPRYLLKDVLREGAHDLGHLAEYVSLVRSGAGDLHRGLRWDIDEKGGTGPVDQEGPVRFIGVEYRLPFDDLDRKSTRLNSSH